MLKKLLVLCLKLALAFTLLFWLYDSDALDLSAFRQLAFDSRTAQLLGLNAILLFCGAILLSLRMWRLLNLLAFEVGIKEAIRVNLASMCLGLILPGLVGVDAIRATYFCLKTRDRKVDAFTCILADRIIGIYALILLAAIGAVIGVLIELQSVHRVFVMISGGSLIVFTLALAITSSRKLLEQSPVEIARTKPGGHRLSSSAGFVTSNCRGNTGDCHPSPGFRPVSFAYRRLSQYYDCKLRHFRNPNQ